MNSQLKNPVSSFLWGILICLLMFSCKKESIEREIDAFSNLNNRVEYVNGQYILYFRLAKFNYKQVNVKLANDLSSFHPSTPNNTEEEYNVLINDSYECSVFFDPLENGETYFYQITVHDAQDNQIVSDVYSFNTQ